MDLASILSYIFIGLIFVVGWYCRGHYEHCKHNDTHCGSITISPTDIDSMYEAKIEINDQAALYKSKEVIFTVIHTQDIQ